ncbi:Do family serine endopeptidase [Hellea sp.]|jgi:Do/DeqQ family serine protease|nr:Do family serine endopeptidase [Hellea sp.]MDC1062596.1 Do family serine endopeptidase [Hellea sp.]MDG1126583.1 Do family serine endopeptidase [Hellea sp.]
MPKKLLVTTLLIGCLISQEGHSQALLNSGSAMSLDSERGVLSMAPLLDRITPAVVSINVRSTAKAPKLSNRNEELLERFFGGRMPNEPREKRGLGSGVIVNAADGLIITNAHVIEDADEIIVTLKDKRQLEAEIVGTDKKTDIALIKVSAKKLAELQIAKASEVRVGDYVIAVGNPFGLSHSVTSGIVSALGRDNGSGDGYQDFIQTDASINPGNSGGALVNSKGELIGINSAIISRSGGNQGIGFAVPTNIVQAVMRQLISYGEVRRGRIGVLIGDITPTLKEALDLTTLDGALVSQVVEDSPAEKAGLKRDDVIISFNGGAIKDASDIRNAVGLVEPGERYTITYLREGRKIKRRIEVEAVDENDEQSDSLAMNNGPETKNFSGATLANIPADLNLRGGSEGVYVSEVEISSKAQRAGLVKGDVIRSVNRRDVQNLESFNKLTKGEDGPFALSVERNGSTFYVAIK